MESTINRNSFVSKEARENLLDDDAFANKLDLEIHQHVNSLIAGAAETSEGKSAQNSSKSGASNSNTDTKGSSKSKSSPISKALLEDEEDSIGSLLALKRGQHSTRRPDTPENSSKICLAIQKTTEKPLASKTENITPDSNKINHQKMSLSTGRLKSCRRFSTSKQIPINAHKVTVSLKDKEKVANKVFGKNITKNHRLETVRNTPDVKLSSPGSGKRRLSSRKLVHGDLLKQQEKNYEEDSEFMESPLQNKISNSPTRILHAKRVSPREKEHENVDVKPSILRNDFARRILQKAESQDSCKDPTNEKVQNNYGSTDRNSSPKKPKGEHKAKQETSQSKPPKQKNDIVLVSWWIRPKQLSKKVHFLVEGIRTDEEYEMQLWHSSQIKRRLSPLLVETYAGRCYKLNGNGFARKNMKIYNFSEWFTEAFSGGFPENWEQIFKACSGLPDGSQPSAPIGSQFSGAEFGINMPLKSETIGAKKRESDNSESQNIDHEVVEGLNEPEKHYGSSFDKDQEDHVFMDKEDEESKPHRTKSGRKVKPPSAFWDTGVRPDNLPKKNVSSDSKQFERADDFIRPLAKRRHSEKKSTPSGLKSNKAEPKSMSKVTTDTNEASTPRRRSLRGQKSIKFVWSQVGVMEEAKDEAVEDSDISPPINPESSKMKSRTKPRKHLAYEKEDELSVDDDDDQQDELQIYFKQVRGLKPSKSESKKPRRKLGHRNKKGSETLKRASNDYDVVDTDISAPPDELARYLAPSKKEEENRHQYHNRSPKDSLKKKNTPVKYDYYDSDVVFTSPESEELKPKKKAKGKKRTIICQGESETESDYSEFELDDSGRRVDKNRRKRGRPKKGHEIDSEDDNLDDLDNDSIDKWGWKAEERDLLHRLVWSNCESGIKANFWEYAAEFFADKSAQQCQDRYYEVDTEENVREIRKITKKSRTQVSGITAKKGTVTRKRQMRQLLINRQDRHKGDDYFDDTDRIADDNFKKPSLPKRRKIDSSIINSNTLKNNYTPRASSSNSTTQTPNLSSQRPRPRFTPISSTSFQNSPDLLKPFDPEEKDTYINNMKNSTKGGPSKKPSFTSDSKSLRPLTFNQINTTEVNQMIKGLNRYQERMEQKVRIDSSEDEAYKSNVSDSDLDI